MFMAISHLKLKLDQNEATIKKIVKGTPPSNVKAKNEKKMIKKSFASRITMTTCNECKRTYDCYHFEHYCEVRINK